MVVMRMPTVEDYLKKTKTQPDYNNQHTHTQLPLHQLWIRQYEYKHLHRNSDVLMHHLQKQTKSHVTKDSHV